MNILVSAVQWLKESLLTFIIIIPFCVFLKHSRYKHQIVKVLGVFMILNSWIILWICFSVDGIYAFYYALPLHVCSILILLEGISVFYATQLFLEFIYYFGLVGAFFALALPVYVHERSGYIFYDYYISHALMIVIIYYHVINGFIPRRYSLVWSYFFFIIVAAIIFTVNLIFGSNYWYINEYPGFRTGITTSVWPYYLLEWFIWGWLILYILYLPFKKRR